MTSVRPDRLGAFVALSLAIALAPAGARDKKDKDENAAASAARDFDKNPFPSTYRPYPGHTTLITGATVFDGTGKRIDNGVVLLRDGKVAGVGGALADLDVPADAVRIDGRGKFVTPGVIDAHSHLGVYPSPAVDSHSDGNEATAPATPQVWAEHSVWPQDPGFARALANGGVTSLQILPGSANLVGGRSVTLKNVYARTPQGMKFPGAPYSMKMACGENPKRVYGGKGQLPSTRMGNMAANRAMWIKAKEYRAKREAGKLETRDIAMETLAGVLDGEILVQNHCYRADEMALVLDMAKEAGYKVAAFHHAVEAYKIGDLLKANDVCSAIWADWWGFKMESYDAVPENAGILYKAGACVVIHSDDKNGIQRLNQEAAKAQGSAARAGIAISDEEVVRWFTLNPAKAIGVEKLTGSLEPGKMGDMVLWNGNPLSSYSRPEKVWVDGALLFDAMDSKRRPVADFELGQVGEGDVK
ncbi:imidazolonepropionase-like amidohydrolase [Novosphingobium kunmingense]|uniref:Imidazolonepropionase-like amidohydrolase n=1 Tax=Novosphingobium kunmingense TaxID=1211806 RepID=A0A2N0H5E8_9SPHN|nr:amidohydrolase [Novosphingobium kunmingense]PKB14165.1 imidazolonepropionase-like amidohydrolase [Novosphingobium kunmingense]